MTDHAIHASAARGFQQGADIYEKARPSYPNGAIDRIQSLGNKPDVIVDLGAGTGKLTRLLGSVGAREIIAIEPVTAMREHLQAIPIISRVIDGTAENMPLADNSVDMVLCAQAFHWFANHRALAEIHRVLKPNGSLVLIWNKQDENNQAWLQPIREYVNSFQTPNVPRYVTLQWKEAFDDQAYFSPLEHEQFTSSLVGTREGIVNRILSTSFIAALTREEQETLAASVRERLENIEEIRNREELEATQLTDLYWCSALKTSA